MTLPQILTNKRTSHLSRKRFYIMASLMPTGISFCSVNLVLEEKKKRKGYDQQFCHKSGTDTLSQLQPNDALFMCLMGSIIPHCFTCLCLTLISIHPFRICSDCYHTEQACQSSSTSQASCWNIVRFIRKKILSTSMSYERSFRCCCC
jgi:hypothetical protein